MSNSVKTAVVLVLWLLLVRGSMIFFWYPLSTSRDQVLVQSYCSCRFFLVGLTDEPFKNRLLFHRLESQYRARSCVIIRFMFWFNSVAQQACSWCIGATQTGQSIGRQHTKAPRQRSKSRKSSLLSSHSRSTRCLALTCPCSVDPSWTSLNKLSTMADVALLLIFIALPVPMPGTIVE